MCTKDGSSSYLSCSDKIFMKDIYGKYSKVIMDSKEKLMEFIQYKESELNDLKKYLELMDKPENPEEQYMRLLYNKGRSKKVFSGFNTFNDFYSFCETFSISNEEIEKYLQDYTSLMSFNMFAKIISKRKPSS